MKNRKETIGLVIAIIIMVVLLYPDFKEALKVQDFLLIIFTEACAQRLLQILIKQYE